MNISFEPLKKSHFSLLLKWLKTPHVKTWWDQEIAWTPELIEEKYGSYVEGYKLEKGVRKKIQAYIIKIENTEIGYIQFYKAQAFERNEPLHGLPESMAAFDIFIGDQDYVGKGVGSYALKKFLEEFVDPEYEYCFVDTDVKNLSAIKAYEKAGFKKIKEAKNSKEIWMIRQRQKPL